MDSPHSLVCRKRRLNGNVYTSFRGFKISFPWLLKNNLAIVFWTAHKSQKPSMKYITFITYFTPATNHGRSYMYDILQNFDTVSSYLMETVLSLLYHFTTSKNNKNAMLSIENSSIAIISWNIIHNFYCPCLRKVCNTKGICWTRRFTSSFCSSFSLLQFPLSINAETSPHVSFWLEDA